MLNEKSMTHESNPAAHRSEVSETKARTHTVTKIAILSAIAFVLMMLEFPVPLMPPFLKFDFSDVPALLASFSIGPGAGVIVELIKNIMHLPFTGTMMVGELANFLIGSTFVYVAGTVYRRNKTKANAIKGMLLGTLVFTLFGCLFNYFINIPFYVNVMGFKLDAIIGLSHAAGNTLVNDLNTLILWVFVPFNLVKGLIVSAIVHFLYKPLSPLLHK